MAQQAPKKRVIYLGGPIDYAPFSDEWRHDPKCQLVTGKGRPYTVYCPACECRTLPDEKCMEQNMLILKEAYLAVFDLRSHSIGTPIEMFLRVWVHDLRAIIIGTEESLFIRQTLDRYPQVDLVPDVDTAIVKARSL